MCEDYGRGVGLATGSFGVWRGPVFFGLLQLLKPKIAMPVITMAMTGNGFIGSWKSSLSS